MGEEDVPNKHRITIHYIGGTMSFFYGEDKGKAVVDLAKVAAAMTRKDPFFEIKGQYFNTANVTSWKAWSDFE